MKLGAFVFGLMGEAAAMRKSGVSLEDVQRGLHASLLTYAREHGLIVPDSELPYWQLSKCDACGDNGWQQTTRIVRGVEVEAYRRCMCKAQGIAERRPDFRANAADKVASGWR